MASSLAGAIQVSLQVAQAALNQEDIVASDTHVEDVAEGLSTARQTINQSFQNAYSDIAERPFREVSHV
jgi:hypothetical protein